MVIGKIQMPTTIRSTDVEVGAIDHTLNAIPEELFFSDREGGEVRPNTVPLPEGAGAWRHGRFMGEEVHVTNAGSELFMLADTTIFGYCLFRFVSTTEDDSTYRIAFQRGNRIITKERSQVIMANLSDLARNYQGNVAPMNLGGQTPAPMAPATGEGISGSVDSRRLRAEAVSRGYVAGYVMGNAPQLTMSLQNKKDKAGNVISNIVAKESKPSRCLAVLLALPANCVMRNGSMASPSDIQAGAVEYGSTPRDEMVYQAFPVNAAISYIYALGGRLPEYAPFVSDAREQWTPEDIISGKPEVSFVYVHPTENRSRNSSSQDRFRFNLKTTSGRRSLYTDRNIVCLRALEHVSTKCNTEAEAYELNEMAFGAWRYRKQKDSTENALQKAMAACPSQIWNAKYNVNGEVKEGIGSAFFMAGSTVTSESGEEIASRPLTYMPWYPSGDQRPTVPSRVERLVRREFQPATSDTKERMVTKPVLMKEKPADPLFKTYIRFVDFIESKGFMTREKLFSMGARASKAKTKSLTLTPEQRTTLEYFMRSEAVDADIQMVRNEAADRAVLSGR